MTPETILITGICTLAAAVASLAGIIFGIAKWMQRRLIEPALKEHLALVASLRTELPKQSALLVSIAKSNKHIEAAVGKGHGGSNGVHREGEQG